MTLDVLDPEDNPVANGALGIAPAIATETGEGVMVADEVFYELSDPFNTVTLVQGAWYRFREYKPTGRTFYAQIPAAVSGDYSDLDPTIWIPPNGQPLLDDMIDAILSDPDSDSYAALLAFVEAHPGPTGPAGPAVGGAAAVDPAYGNGVTNATTYIQGLIDGLTATGGGTVDFPPGDYVIDTLILKAGVTLRGSLNEVGGLTSSGTVSTVKFIPGSVLTGPYILGDTDDPPLRVAVVGIDLNCAGVKAEGIRIGNTFASAIKDVSINAPVGRALTWDVGSVACITESLLVSNAFATEAVTNNGAVVVNGTDHYFLNCQIGCGNVGVATAAGFTNAWFVSGANHSFVGCNGEFSDHGWMLATTLSKFVNCRGDRNNMSDWDLRAATYNQFTNCAAYDGAADTSVTDSVALRIAAANYGNVFIGFRWYMSPAERWVNGIEDATVASASWGQNQFIACDGVGNSGPKFNLPATLGGVPIHAGGAVRPTAGTTTPDVEGATLVQLDAYVSGVTTITNFLNGTPGQVIKVLGDANVLIAHNANIKMTSGNNRLLRADTVYEFVFYNGVWTEVGPPASPGVTAASGSGVIDPGVTDLLNTGATDYKYTLFANSSIDATDMPTTVATRTAIVRMVFVQDATGGRTLTLTNFRYASGVAPTLASAGSAQTLLLFYWDGTSWWVIDPANTAATAAAIASKAPLASPAFTGNPSFASPSAQAVTTHTTGAALTLTSTPYNRIDATSGAVALSLPATTTPGLEFVIRKVDKTANLATVTATLIDGTTTYTLRHEHDTVTVRSTTVSGTWEVTSRTDKARDAMWKPPDNKLLACNFPPRHITASRLLVTNTYQLNKVRVPAGVTITNILCYVTAAGVTLSAAAAAVYETDGTKVGETASQTTAWQSTGLKTMALSSPVAAQDVARDVWVGYAAAGTTLPQMGMSSTFATANFGLAAADKYNSGYVTAALPFSTPLTMTALNDYFEFWAGIS